MIAALFAFSYAIGIFALLSEVQSGFLQVIGWAMASWMVIAGAMSGIGSSRK